VSAADDSFAWTEERTAEVGEIGLCYQEMGDPAGEPMVLVMGLGTQMIHWEESSPHPQTFTFTVLCQGISSDKIIS